MEAFITPKVSASDDTSNFDVYPDSVEESGPLINGVKDKEVRAHERHQGHELAHTHAARLLNNFSTAHRNSSMSAYALSDSPSRFVNDANKSLWIHARVLTSLSRVFIEYAHDSSVFNDGLMKCSGLSFSGRRLTRSRRLKHSNG